MVSAAVSPARTGTRTSFLPAGAPLRVTGLGGVRPSERFASSHPSGASWAAKVTALTLSANVWHPGQSGNSASHCLPSRWMNASYCMGGSLRERDARLLGDALERSGRNVLLRMRDRDDAGLARVFEMLVRALGANEDPPVGLQEPDDVGG